MQTCPTCGAPVGDDARFCPACGSELSGSCISCGTVLPREPRFCPSCGTPVGDGPSGPGEERKLVTVLFADVTGSTALGEGLDPESLRAVLDTYFQAMRREIEAEGGTVEKFIGDAVVAVFGVPAAHEDDPARALRAALRMLARLDEVNDVLEAGHGLRLQIRIGVTTGEVLASSDPTPGEPMVTGDTVNTAARLQTAAETGAVLVGERTARAVRGFRFGAPIELDLKGKARPVTALALLGGDGAPDRGVPGLQAPMVGRDRELDVLRSVFDRVVDERRPHLVTVYGDPGVGKSRLTREFLTWAATHPSEPTVTVGRCLPYGDGITYWPLAEILKSHLGVRDSDPADDVLARLDALHAMAPDSIDGVRLRAALAATLGLDDPRSPVERRDPREVRRDVHGAWRWFLSALAARAPTLVVIEDVHWADAALLDLLEELAEGVGGAVLFVCPARPELTDRRPTWGGGRRNVSSLALDPLTSDESDRLIRLLLDVEDLPPPVHTRILERAEGNPFFLEEIVRHLIDEGSIELAGDRWRATSRIDEVEIPDTVQGVLSARIDLLEPADKRTLQLAAVVGRVFWPGSVRAQLNGDGDALEATLERLRSRDLVLSRIGSALAGEYEFIFKHVLTRDVAYESLPRRDRARAHAAVAAWIEDATGERVREFAELLAHHYLRAYEGTRETESHPEHVRELHGRALEALLDAARQARQRFAVGKAFRLVDEALALAERPGDRALVLEARGLTALSDYRGDMAWASFREAADLRLEHTPEDHEGIARACARAVESPTRWPGSMSEWPPDDDVIAYIDVGLEHAGTDPTSTLIRLLTAKAFVPFGLSSQAPATDEQVEAAVAEGLRAADLATELGRPDLAAAALDGSASAHVDRGMYGRSRPITRRRLELANRVDSPWELGDIYAMAAWESSQIGEYRESLRHAAAGFAALEGTGAEGATMHCAAWAAYAEFMLGEWDRVVDERLPYVRARLGERGEEPPYFTQNAFSTAALVHRFRGERAELERLIPVLLRWAGDLGTHHGQGAVRAWLAWLHLLDGDVAQAETFLDATLAPSRLHRPHVELVRIELLAVAERWHEVPAYLEQARAYAAEAGLLALGLHLDRLEGRAAAAGGGLDIARRLLGGAIEGFDALETAWQAARARLELAEILAAAERPGEARTALAGATDVFAAIRSVEELRRARALLDGA